MDISLMLFGNSVTHSELSIDHEVEYNRVKGGLPIIGSSGLPVAISYQGIDFEINQWLKDIKKRRDYHFEWFDDPFFHSIMPLQNIYFQKWMAEKQKSNIGCIDVTFDAEFASRDCDLIHTKNFLVLESQSYCYSMDLFDAERGLETQIFPQTPALNYGGKTGIIIPTAGEIIAKRFYEYQAVPSKKSTEALMTEIKKIGFMPDGICPVAWDVEAMVIGSRNGIEKVLEDFLNNLVKNDLIKVFSPLSKWLEYFSKNSVKSPKPHRANKKWLIHPAQYNLQFALVNHRPRDEREFLLYGLASTSDLLSALFLKIESSKKPRVLFNEVKLQHNQQIIEILMRAFKALIPPKKVKKQLTFQELLKELFAKYPDYRRGVGEKILQYAEMHEL